MVCSPDRAGELGGPNPGCSSRDSFDCSHQKGADAVYPWSRLFHLLVLISVCQTDLDICFAEMEYLNQFFFGKIKV